MKKIFINGNLHVSGNIQCFGVLQCFVIPEEVNEYFVISGNVEIIGNLTIPDDVKILVAGILSCDK